MTLHVKFEFSAKRRINSEFLKRRKLQKQNSGNLNI